MTLCINVDITISTQLYLSYLTDIYVSIYLATEGFYLDLTHEAFSGICFGVAVVVYFLRAGLVQGATTRFVF